MIPWTEIQNDEREMEFNCLGFPSHWYKLTDYLKNSSYSTFTPLSVRLADNKEIIFRDEIATKMHRRKQLDEIIDI
jgi:hypothetical protein